jgi:hypothetical protein
MMAVPSISDCIKELARELALRRNFYPSLVVRGKLTEEKSQQQQESVRAAIKYLELLQQRIDGETGVNGNPFVDHRYPKRHCRRCGHGYHGPAAICSIECALALVGLCSDCPPVGYPTDKTRCTECPRRST